MSSTAIARMACIVALSCPAAAAVVRAEAPDPEWPMRLEHPEATVIIYQPQVDSFDGNLVESRAAVAVTPAGATDPVFGAVWTSARVDTDRDTRTVRVVELDVRQVRFADASEKDQEKLIAFLESEIPKLEIEVALDRLLPDLDEEAPAGVEALKHVPPTILVRLEPALLVLVDGGPRYEKVDTTAVERVVNTPYLLLRYRGNHYLSTDGGWFEARELSDQWRLTTKPPKKVRQVAEKMAEPGAVERKEPPDGQPDLRTPAIIVSTEPAELIVVDGEPQPAPVGDGDLLEVLNTESDLVFHVPDQSYYVLLSGRWYLAGRLEGPWRWVANDALPDAFAAIPVDSPLGYLRTSVAGTDESREAMLDQVVPQTAAIRRDDSSATVSYDGAPRFEEIEGTSMRYAVNTSSSVIKVGSRYYLCEQGVWYVAASATGPWSVCDDVPDEVYTIPPSSPVYNVTYVNVYHATPEVVYVGYTPGYVGSYVSHGCVVYGTGWWYRPWWGTVYYPRPWTWGFHVRYNSWYGWSYGVSWSNGPFTITIGAGGYAGGWWGPGWYRPYPWYGYGYGYRHGYRHGYWAGAGRPSQPIAPPGARPPAGSTRPSQLPAQNIYARPANLDRVAQRPATADRVRPAPATGRPNDVLVGPDGGVFRPGPDGGWQTRENGQWRPATPPAQQPSTRPAPLPSQPVPRPAQPETRPSQPHTRPAPSRPPSTLDQDWGARQRGAQRSQSYRAAPSPRPMPSARPAAGARRP